jgi:comEA protein
MRSSKLSVLCALFLFFGMAFNTIPLVAQPDETPGTGKININTATVEQLQVLPGIGPALAKRILEHRAKVGKFNRIEEILNVKGMGEKKFLKIKDRLVV